MVVRGHPGHEAIRHRRTRVSRTPRWYSTVTGPWPEASTGTPEALPNVQHNKPYLAELDILPDYRLTCFFVDRDYRRQGMARVALAGALHLIALAGRGVVPQKTSASFLYNAMWSLFEQAGHTYIRSKGKPLRDAQDGPRDPGDQPQETRDDGERYG
jgi:GNAT superfamily N-acetyltransferase